MDKSEGKIQEVSDNPNPSTSGNMSASKKKKVYNMEPRTPLKRQRVPVNRFQSPATEELPTSAQKTPKGNKEEVVVLQYKKGVFLAVRGDEGSFYMCRTQQNVYKTTKHFKIQWLDLNEPPNIYKFDFLDATEIECVLTNVKMERIARETYRLPHSEQTRIENILLRALKKEKGEPIEEDDMLVEESGGEEDFAEDDSEEEDWEDDEPSAKKPKYSKSDKPKATPKSRKSITVALKGSGSKKSNTKSKGKKIEKEKVKKQKKEKKPEKERKRGPDRKLKPNPKVRIVEKDPLFQTKDHVPFISKNAHAKLVFRAIFQNDIALLKQLLEDSQHIYSVGAAKSLTDSWTSLHYALKNNNVEAVKLLAKDILADADADNVRRKLPKPRQLISTISTGTYNPRYLGVQSVRKLTVGRGSKEGNQAFTKEKDEYNLTEDIITDALQMGVNKETLDVMIANSGDNYNYNDEKLEKIVFAVLRGHRSLAGKLMEDALNRGGFGFNFLHKDVLVFNNEDLKQFQSASVRKKPLNNASMTPLHCACINPNIKYLEKLLSVEPDINLEDKGGRRPIHYAASCESTAPLELLIKKGANPNEVTRRRFTPLHYACYAERPKNIDLLLKTAAAKTAAEGDGGDPMMAKWGIGGINRPNWETVCPIHIAVQSGNAEVVKALLKHGVDVNKPLSASKEKVSPLMIAAGKGYLDIARLLIQAGAVVEQVDKFKRTALTHAVMNGSVTVTSYLLYLGADPNRVDSSNNSLVHYAAAYGWYFVLKMLVNEGGADPKKANDWKLTPVGIAFMKAHMGLVDFLLKMPGVDINFKNDSGMTLISIACGSVLNSGLYEQIVYLMDKGSDPSITDINGMNALHHLAGNTVKPSHTGVQHYQKSYDENMDLSVKIAELLMKAGCNPAVKTLKKQTAVTLAIEKVNTKLVRVLVEKGGVISAEKDEDGANALHHLAQQCMGNDLAPLLKILAQENPLNNIKENGLDEKMEVDSNDNGDVVKMDKEPEIPKLKRVTSFRSGLEGIKQMVTEVDHSGYTPFLLACCTYANFKKPHDMKDSEVPKVYQNGCDFIRTLIELTGLDVSMTVQKKYQVNDVVKKKATDEKKEYNEFGKQSAVHFMINRGKKSSDGADYQGLRMVLEKKPDLELKNLDGKSALAVAVEKQDKQAVKILLEAGANPNTSFLLDKETTVTALTTAAKLGNPDLVQMLVRAKAQVDCRNSKTKQTPLHLAVANRGKESNAVDMAVALLEGGADINSLDNDKCTPLHLVVSANSGTSNASTDLEELLISRGANVYAKDIENRMPLHYAFLKQGRPSPCTALDPIELCSVLTKAMKDQQIDEMDKYCLTPLHLAANRGATICCVHLLQRKAEVNRHDQDGNTPLSLAVNKGHDSCAIMLIQKGANVADKVNIVPPEKKEEEKDKKPSWKWKPERVVEKDETETYSIFQEAIMNELQGVAHMVLDNTTLDSKVIEAALRVNRYHVALRLLKRINTLSSLQITNASRQNLLHVLALDTEPRSQADLQLKVAKMLVEKGVSVSAIDDYGCTPLHYACLKHQAFGLGEFLMEQDKTLDLSKKDKFGRSVLGAFFWNQRVISESVEESTKWLKMFLSKGGNFNILYDYPTSDVPTFDVVQNVVPDYFTTASERRISPIIFSIHFADFGMVKFLLDHGVSPNFPDSEGVTPLMHAVRSNDLSLVKLLLNYSFDSDDTTSKKLALVKKASREVFTIKTFNSLTSVPEEDDIEEEEEEDGDNEEKEESEEEEEDAGDEGDQEDEDDNNDQEDDDNDHDTDIVDWDEDGEDDTPEQFPTLTRMGSKQVSLTRQGSSVNKEEFPTIEKTSPVDLNATDRQGWTVIHHLVCPLDYGTYDAEEILYVLWKAGADVLKKDNAGLSPLQHSLIHCASKLSKRLQMIAGVEESKMEKPTLATQDVRDSLLSGETTVNYQTDAEEMLKTLDSHSSQSMKVSKVKGDDSDDDFDSDEEEDIIAKPDPNCQMKDIGELAMDDSQGIPYDVLLSKVDVSCGAWGMFNFYKMQIVWQKGVDVYVLFTRWGRIGDRGQFQHTPFQKKAEAVAEFGKVFRSKTGNYWSNVNSFEKQPKKYRLVPRDDKRQKEHKIEFSLKSDIPSKLPESVQHLFQEMTSVSMMLAAVNKTGIYSDAMPFGKIKREALIEGRKSLNQIGDLIKAIENQQKSGMMTAEDTQSYQSNCEKISKVTNEYYHLIPHYGFTFEKITPINTYGLLKKHMKVLSDLLDLECASKMLLGAQSKLSQMNPLDYIHQAVGCKIEPMTEDSPESQYILKYLYSSCETEVQAIYKLSRPGEEERLSGKNLDNHKLLFHGSSTANFLSILHRGLLVSPPEVPFTGNLFGEGVYFADTFCKSKDYCYNTNPESTTNLCLVCEVALGKVQECPMYVGTPTQDLRDTDFNSKCILGRQGPNPAFNIALPYGPTIPLGMQHDAHPSVGRYMSFSEYVIQDPSQICLRYLIEFTKANQRSGT